MERVVRREDMRLYAVTDRSWLKGETLYRQVEKALLGGVSFVQLREKQLPYEEFLAQAKEIRALCARYGVPFVINDHVGIAWKTDADGVHIGQDDMDIREARRILGPDKIIGASAHTVEQAVTAQEQGADYLGAGAVFPTASKQDAGKLSKETLQAICRAVEIPVVAIGGINAQNIVELAGSGIAGVAVISAIFGAKEITAAAKDLREKVEKII